jgi:hypothetical protein
MYSSDAGAHMIEAAANTFRVFIYLHHIQISWLTHWLNRVAKPFQAKISQK